MSNPSDAPPSSTNKKITDPVSQLVRPTADSQDAKIAAIRESPPSVFVNSEPIREDQVENAVKFLSHPKVMGSPVKYRRSFLEGKGLTKEEIDEAFRRVPDSTPAAATFQPVVTTQDDRINSSSNVRQQVPTQITQPSQILPVGSISKTGTVSRFHWSYALFAVGFLAASGFGTIVLFKKTIVPRLKSWICKVVLEGEEGQMKKNDTKPSVAEEAAAAAKAGTEAARASQEIMISKGEENRCFEALINLLNIQVQEMKSMRTVIQKLELGQSSVNGRIIIEEQADHPVQTISRQPYANGRVEVDSRSVRSLSPPPPKQPSVATPHPKSYMEILEMIQRGEKPSNIREINDAPPYPNQPLSNPRLAPKHKPWEANQAQNSSTNTLLTQERISYSSNYEFLNKELNGAGTVPWWQQTNVRITEIGDGEGQKVGSSAVSGVEKGVRRSWVPPQPPPVVMPEAAAAIRQAKKPSFQNEQLTDDQLLARSLDMTNDMKGNTVISESGDVIEASVESLSELRMGENALSLES